MPHLGLHGSSEHRNHPAEPPVRPAADPQPLAIEGEAREDQEHAQQRVKEPHGPLGQRIVSQELGAFAGEQHVVFDGIAHALPPPGLPYRQDEQLPGVPVADKGPVDPHREGDGENIAGDEMDLPHGAHEEMVTGLALQRREWIGDEISGHRQHHDAQCVNPVPDPHRCLEDVNRIHVLLEVFAACYFCSHIGTLPISES